MKFELAGFDKDHYAIDLQQSGGTLKWATKGATHHLMAWAPYGTDIVFDAGFASAIEGAGSSRLLAQKELILADKGFAIVMLQKSQVNMFRFAACPAAYAVFCCEYRESEDICTVYVPNEACCYRCNVAACVKIKVEREPKKKRVPVFAKKEAGRGHFLVEIPAIPGYSSGLLHYTYEGCALKFPVTERMLGKQVFVPSYGGKPPVFKFGKESGYFIEQS